MYMKICSVCKIEKSLEEYNNKPGGKFGKAARCIECEAAYAKAWREANYEVRRAKEKAYKEQNREAIRERSRRDYHSIPVDVRKELSRIKKQKYAKAFSEGKKKYRSRPEIKQRDREYVQKRYKEDTQFKLSKLLRQRHSTYCWKNRVKKAGSSIKDLGCTIEEAMQYIESKFEPWMNWDNNGKYDPNKQTWQLDHVTPLCKFDLTNPEEFKKAAHYTNLQPLEAIKNLKKNRF